MDDNYYTVIWTLPEIGYKREFPCLDNALDFIRGNPGNKNITVTKDDKYGNPVMIVLSGINP